MITEEKFKALKRDVETARSQSEQAQGALNQLKQTLKEEFDCDDLKSAKKKLAKLQKESEEASRTFESALADYEKKWKSDD